MGLGPDLGRRRLRGTQKPLARTRTRGRLPTSGEQRTDGRSPSARRKKLQPSVGLLARGSQTADFAICGHPPLPRPLVEWVREGGLHLQWRDRAGFDRLPCYAQVGTEGTIQFSDYGLL